MSLYRLEWLGANLAMLGLCCDRRGRSMSFPADGIQKCLPSGGMCGVPIDDGASNDCTFLWDITRRRNKHPIDGSVIGHIILANVLQAD